MDATQSVLVIQIIPGVDKKVDEAITYLESIHDMKDWVPFKFDIESSKVKVK